MTDAVPDASQEELDDRPDPCEVDEGVPMRPGDVSGTPFEIARRLHIAEVLDDEIEWCRRQRLPLRGAADRLLPSCCGLLGAQGALLRALDERLELCDCEWGELDERWLARVPEDLETLYEGDAAFEVDGISIIMRALDCAGEVVGVLAIAFTGGLAEDDLRRSRSEVRQAAEELDNYLELIASAARKQRITVSATQALRNPIFEGGVDSAIGTLSQELDIEEAVLVYGDPDLAHHGALRYRVYRDGAVVAASKDRPSEALRALLEGGADLLAAEEGSLEEMLGGKGIVQSQLINGLSRRPVGKLAVRSRWSGLDPEGVDVISVFAECLSQRLVDYNRERRVLARSFSPIAVARLLRETNKFERFLQPRVAEVAVLFADLVSFTAICEQVLEDASAIGRLIDRWAEGAVQIIFEHGGCFDKLVGDCAIGLFGPPFFESEIAERAQQATRAALAIRAFTDALGAELGLHDRIREAGLGDGLRLTVGVHLGPTSVGFFGPNDDYTGFSSVVNQTARLQGLAEADQVFISSKVEPHVRGDLEARGLALGGPHEAQVKNVQDPLRYFDVVSG